MTWTTPVHTFTCGACGSTVTALLTISAVEKVMRVHAELCPKRALPADPVKETPDA